MKSNFTLFSFLAYAFGVIFKKISSQSQKLLFSLMSFRLLVLMLRTVIRLCFIFMDGVTAGPRSSDAHVFWYYLLRRPVVMVRVTGQFDYSSRCSGIWLDIILGVSVRLFLDETTFVSINWVKQTALPTWANFIPCVEDLVEKKRQSKGKFAVSAWLCPNTDFSCTPTRDQTGAYTIGCPGFRAFRPHLELHTSPPGSPACQLHTVKLLSLHHCGISYISILLVLLVLFLWRALTNTPGLSFPWIYSSSNSYVSVGFPGKLLGVWARGWGCLGSAHSSSTQGNEEEGEGGPQGVPEWRWPIRTAPNSHSQWVLEKACLCQAALQEGLRWARISQHSWQRGAAVPASNRDLGPLL